MRQTTPEFQFKCTDYYLFIFVFTQAIRIQEIIDTKFARLSIVDTRYSLWDYYFPFYLCDDSNQFSMYTISLKVWLVLVRMRFVVGTFYIMFLLHSFIHSIPLTCTILLPPSQRVWLVWQFLLRAKNIDNCRHIFDVLTSGRNIKISFIEFYLNFGNGLKWLKCKVNLANTALCNVHGHKNFS